MKQPKKPTLAQKKLIADAGLDPEKWLVRYEDNRYLHIIDRGVLEQREVHIIDRQTGEIAVQQSIRGACKNGKCPGI
ncbi:hypothetical protein BRYFOR_07581 [Marvinbryantia formatexigens DSM 14469]|uniref:DUF6906 domain-containing protein n=1 Tax=Marvinbryantia formatexigens DSM 14469 TaxID=478749 RepID=C6LG21_9FIRM|nr:hypothetical protein [Marvinbryantia formatexigens]EET60385.1 hypothetical protein BRYFOR_07581 [Marvinbryantia formatexigens DSM 14469]UWO25275.1 hypothetical protein NQ534_01925 [Marvinbryantia formatexigens DSM 14469]SDH03302.1 hypothetical protein SAMN05660368_03713 [Marvinbryantia formatexigens]